jgi:hypothetical protein
VDFVTVVDQATALLRQRGRVTYAVIGHEVPLPLLHAIADVPAVALGAAYTLGGRVADAVLLLTQALEQTVAQERTGFQAFWSLSRGGADVGWLEESHALAEGALAHAYEHQERGHEAYAFTL